MKIYLFTFSLLFIVVFVACKKNTPSVKTTSETISKPVFDDGYPTTVSDVMLDSLYDFYFWLHHRDVTDRAIARFTNQLKASDLDSLSLMKIHRRLAVAYMMAYEIEKCNQEIAAMTRLAATVTLDNLEKAKVAATQAYRHYWFNVTDKNGFSNIALADSLMRQAVGKNDIRSVQMHLLQSFYAFGLGNVNKAIQNLDSALVDYKNLSIAYPSVEAWAHLSRAFMLKSNVDGDWTRANTFFDKKTWNKHPVLVSCLQVECNYTYKGRVKAKLEKRIGVFKLSQEALHEGHPKIFDSCEDVIDDCFDVSIFDKALAIKNLNYLLNHPKSNKASTYSLAVKVYAACGEPQKTDRYTQKATDYIAKNKLPINQVGMAYDRICYGHCILNRWDTVIYWAKKAMACYKQSYGVKSLYYNGSLNALTYPYALKKDFEKSFYYSQQVFASIGYTEDDKNFEHVINLKRFCYNTIGRVNAASLKFLSEKSIKSYNEAEAAFDLYYRIQERRNLLNEGNVLDDIFYGETKTINYQAIDRNLLFGDTTKAFSYIERDRLLTMQSGYNIDPSIVNVPKDLLDREKQLRADLTNLQKRMSEFGEKEEWQNQVLEKQEQLDKLMLKLKTDYSNYFQMRYNTKPALLADIQQQILDDQTALIEYYVTNSTLYVFIILKNTIKTTQLSYSNELIDQIEKFRKEISTTNPTANAVFFSQLSAKIYDQLLRGVLKKLPPSVNKLIISPDGVLSYLPFEVLMPSSTTVNSDFRQNDFLLKRYQISYAYSASLLLEQKRTKRHDAKHLFAGFAPKYEDKDTLVSLTNKSRTALTRQGAYELKGAKDEVSIISQLLDGQAFVNESATEGVFKKQANQYRILHFAMHSLTDDKEPMFSKLLFTLTPKDTTQDNDLTAGELYAMPLNADLAVLSACNTGYGQLSRGEGVMSLARAFTYSGVPATVTSLWKVPDLTTQNIMVDFYKNLKKGMTKDAALREAKLTYLNNAPESIAANPFFWAGFVPMGNMEAMDLSEPSPLSIPLILGGLVALWGIGSWFYQNRNRY